MGKVRDALGKVLHRGEAENRGIVIQNAKGEMRTVKNAKQAILDGLDIIWNRPKDTVVDQLGIDLPRLASKCTFISPKSNEELFKLFKETELCPVYESDYHLIPNTFPKELLLSYEEVHQKYRLPGPRQAYYIKAILLLFATIFTEEDPYKFIMMQFENFFDNPGEMGLTCTDFIEKAFLKNEKNIDIPHFPFQSVSFNLMRTLTQGHFASITTELQSILGMDNITSNLKHQIFITIPNENEENIRITHIKEEFAHWGGFVWHLSCLIDPKGDKLLSVDLAIDEIQLTVCIFTSYSLENSLV